MSESRRRSLFIAALVGALAGAATPLREAHAAVFTVNTTQDAVDAVPGDGICRTAAGDCSVRAAIMEANALGGADTVAIPAGIDMLTLGALTVTDETTIMGAGAAATIIDGGGIDRVFDLVNPVGFPPMAITIVDVTIRNGRPVIGPGGGIAVGSGVALRLERSVVTANSAVEGGAILNATAARLVITASTLSDNRADLHGGGILNRGDELTITDSTFSNNAVTGFPGEGGGIDNRFAAVTLTNVTLSGNQVPNGSGGAIFTLGGFVMLSSSTLSGNGALFDGGGLASSSATIVVDNTILDNEFPGNCSLRFGAITSAGYNLDSDGTCAFAGPGDLVNVDPLLGALQDNGGPTQTHSLLEGSPAIDAGSPACPPPATDQRGVTRPGDGDSDGTAVCDIGAFELAPISPVLRVTVDIKPGSRANSVNPRSRGVIRVAILTTDTFDAATVDPLSVRFGRGGAAEAHRRGHVADVNGDGRLDLVLHFRIRKSGIRCGDTSASLTGSTLDGQAIEGSDSITTVGCR